MRIGTYNVLGLTGYPPAEARKELGGPETDATVAHFGGVFESLGCDILALQEGVAPALINRIARAMGVNAATFPSPQHWPGHLLTRYPILESRVFSHAGPDTEKKPFSRTAGAALLALDEHARLWVMVLHLHPSIREIRDAEAEIVRARVHVLLGETPNAIVLGDFNCPVTEPVHDYLKADGFVNAMETVGGGLVRTMGKRELTTMPAIDHIYVSPALAGRLVWAEVVSGPGFREDEQVRQGVWVHSDHMPVWADLSEDAS